MKIILYLISICSLISVNSAEKILFLMPIATKSHKNVFEPLINELGKRGHAVSVISPVKSIGMSSNVKEITPSTVEEFLKSFPNVFEMRKKGKLQGLFWDIQNILNTCRKVFANPDFQEMINQKYDLVIMNGFGNTCFDGVIYKLKAPHILLTTMAAPGFITEFTGNYLPASFVPLPFLALTDRMTFLERFFNGAITKLISIFFNVYYKQKYEDVYREALGQDYPGIYEIHGNVSLVMMNSHFSLTYMRPRLPDNIEVGGMHCRPPKTLPRDLKEFVDGADHGFIYFSLGSIVSSNSIPEETRLIFVRVFSKLKQRVLWKWDADEMPGLSDNVRISKWLPQQDLLGHPKIRVFITHGGLLSTQEAVYHGVPLIGLPIFVDQDLNMQQAESQGYALTLEILDLNEAMLEEKLNRIINEPGFTESAKRLSSVFRDQTETPLERAVYWSEYVIRHKGAVHLRSAARNLNYFQIHSLDVVAFLATILIAILIILKFTCTRVVRTIFGSSKNKQKTKSD